MGQAVSVPPQLPIQRDLLVIAFGSRYFKKQPALNLGEKRLVHAFVWEHCGLVLGRRAGSGEMWV